jgi:hypothetical protein
MTLAAASIKMNTCAKFTDPLYGPCLPASLTQVAKGCTVAPPSGHVDMVEVRVPSAGKAYSLPSVIGSKVDRF